MVARRAARYACRIVAGNLLETAVRVPGGGTVPAIVARPNGASPATPIVVLAHGAGAGMRSGFMLAMRDGLAARSLAVLTFEFPYMAAGRRRPDPAPVLERTYAAVLHAVRAELAPAAAWIAIGGKSMGGRMASHLAARGGDPLERVRALVLLGYPLSAAGHPERLRADHLPAIRMPTLFVQGTRDALADLAQLRPIVTAMPAATLHVVDTGDHSLVPLRRSGKDAAAAWAEVAGVVAGWLPAR